MTTKRLFDENDCWTTKGRLFYDRVAGKLQDLIKEANEDEISLRDLNLIMHFAVQDAICLALLKKS